ncbi:universal stress protein [uncultured Leifsonia sp.]|uniref:universal stress protein n=1 Tax=uncultured Leifsonia sp. TaxID=340359 RepID=UPI0028D77C07|nr:universal stress protein [uncultured Leifsonia sp.]
MPARTVVCWNGSEAAEAALTWALRRFRASGAAIAIVDVVEYALYLGDSAALDRARSQEQDRLDARTGELDGSDPGAVVSAELLVGDPLELLTARADGETLLVVGTRHRIGPRVRYGWSLGSRLATAAAGAVAVVPVEEDEAAAERQGVVVGVDGSETGRRALAFAAAEAEKLGASLTIVHCWVAPLAEQPLVVPDDEFVTSQESERRDLLDDHERTVRDAHPGLAVHSVLLRQNPISGLRLESEHAEMLVVGSRGLTGWKRTWLGSVSHGLILDLAAPTVVVGDGTVVPAARARVTLGA